MTKFVFNHIPKTAGTSLRVWLEQFFRPEEIYPGYHFGVAEGIPVEAWERYRFFGAHHAYWRGGGGEDAVRITWMREPEAHVRSIYRYQVEQLDVPRDGAAVPVVPGYDSYVARLRAGMTFDEFLDDAASDGFGFHSYQARWLGASEGALDNPDADVDAVLARAREALEECLVAGVVERFQDSVDVLCHGMGWPPYRFGIALNRSGSRGVQAGDRAWEEFRRGNVDYALYTSAVELLDRRVAAMRSELEVGDSGGDGDGAVHDALHARFLREGDATLVGKILAAGEVLYGEGWGPRTLGADPERAMIRWMGEAGSADAFFPAELAAGTEFRFRVVRNRGHGILRTLTVEIDGVTVPVRTEAAGSATYDRAVRVCGVIPAAGADVGRFRHLRVAVAAGSRDAVVAAGGATMLATDGIVFG